MNDSRALMIVALGAAAGVGGTFTCEMVKKNGDRATVTVRMLEKRIRYSPRDVKDR